MADAARAAGSTADAALRRLGRMLADGRPADTQDTAVDLHVASRPGSVVWGHLPTDLPSVGTVASGAVVRIDTVSHQGLHTDVHPIEFFGALGISADEVLDDVVDVFEQVPRPDGASSHVLTGPLWVEGAEPGDAIEVRLLAADLRVDYGINNARPGAGVLPGLLDEPSVRLLRAEQGRYRFASGVSVPVTPFPGIVAVAPPRGSGFVSARPPDRWGGNLDVKDLTAGSRLFLPVFAAGAQLFVGDPHGAQGDGEVDGTAVEHSSSYTLEVVHHPGLALDAPVVDTPTHVVALGIDTDLGVALESALGRAIALMVGLGGGELDAGDAYALCSLAADVAVAEAVNHTAVVVVRIPRAIFEEG
jgi:acetamidase/formamidase